MLKNFGPIVWRLASVCVLAAFILNSVGQAQGSAGHQSGPGCGTWKAELQTQTKDQRIEVALIPKDPGSDCHGLFHLANNTTVHGFGGYALQLNPSFVSATAAWTPAGDANGTNYLLPSPLDLDIRTVPLDRASSATVYISGEPTVGSLVIDTAIFVLNAIVELTPLPTGCLISHQQIAFIALRSSHIIEPAVRLALKGDFLGSRKELSLRADEFISQAKGYAIDAGVSCLGDALEAISQKLVPVSKIVAEYLVWIPVVLFDYFKYQGLPANITLTYTPAVSAPTPTSRPVVPPTAVPQPTAAPQPTAIPPTPLPASYVVTVQATTGWQDSGISLQTNDTVTIDYVSGSWTVTVNQIPPFDGRGRPDGYTCANYMSPQSCVEAMPDAVQGALVGRVGSQLLDVGNHLEFSALTPGHLYLRMNDGDNAFSDNAGALQVRVTVR